VGGDEDWPSYEQVHPIRLDSWKKRAVGSGDEVGPTALTQVRAEGTTTLGWRSALQCRP
jgi:hypothetical protein